ncbi:uncharacterized protein VICG_02178, partial [Vittaforma corneae ATCC 50505]
SSSDEDFIPVGLSMLKLSTKKNLTPVMAQRVREEDTEFPSALQYFSLLSRAMDVLNRNREEESEKLKLGLSVVRKGRKTYINVVDIASQLNRQPEHLSHFLTRSLYGEGNINKDGQLVLSGSFLQSAVEKALRQFIELYVVCRSCENVDETRIVRENKLYFLRCDKCKASRCVGNAIEGFTLKDTPQAKLRGLI